METGYISLILKKAVQYSNNRFYIMSLDRRPRTQENVIGSNKDLNSVYKNLSSAVQQLLDVTVNMNSNLPKVIQPNCVSPQ